MSRIRGPVHAAKGRSRLAPETPAAHRGIGAALRALDGRPFSDYRRIVGSHAMGDFTVHVDRVPADPFMGMARVRVAIDREASWVPSDLIDDRAGRLAVEDLVARAAAAALARDSELARPAAPPGSGRVVIEAPGRAVIERSPCRVTAGAVELRLFVDLPATGRGIRGVRAAELFETPLLRLATASLLFSEKRRDEARRAARAARDHAAAVSHLARLGLVAFVPDGARLDAAAGRPVAFRAPAELAVTIDLPGAGPVRGMGIPAGVTVVVGGAFAGKSTLLRALAAGVHPHPPGDGLEGVAVVASAAVVRAEDRRRASHVDLSWFLVGGAPVGRPGDVSVERLDRGLAQGVSLVEAVEAGARVLLVDEDDSAPSFLVRDGGIRRLVPASARRRVPLLDRLRELYDTLGVSTIVATGGVGAYALAADTVLRMDDLQPVDITREARDLAHAGPWSGGREDLPPLRRTPARVPRLVAAVDVRARAGLRSARGIRVGDTVVDLSVLEADAEPGQLRTLALLLRTVPEHLAAGNDVAALLDALETALDAGLDGLDPPAAYDLVRPRRIEIAAALHRWRDLVFDPPEG
jgi:predicted ABC-class ATPase